MKLRLKTPALAALLFALTVTAEAQNSPKEVHGHNGSPCGTESPGQQWEAELQRLISEAQDTKYAGKSAAQATLYTIPVIIHIIHGNGQPVGTYPNLAQGQINSQIQVLNNDYGGIGLNSGNYPPTAFSAYASSQGLPANNLDAFGRIKIANTMIQFCLATKDTLGNILAEPGIDRINYATKGWTNPASFTSANSFQNYMDGVIKPNTIWNVSKYLNIWVSDKDANIDLLGYATFPLLSTLTGLPGSLGSSTRDGFWCYARCFGSTTYFPGGFYQGGYTYGRTSTHEIGHWLGLRHTWGDGTCATDYCADTPPSFDKNFGFPTYPFNVTGTASCVGSINGSMFMNFMDYTNDPAKYMFTTDQTTRIQTAMANAPYRKFLGTHTLCTVEDIAPNSQFKVPSPICGTAAAVTLTNTSSGTPVPNFTWSASAGATFFPGNTVASPMLNFAGPGVYTVTLTSDNGTLTSVVKTLTVFTPPTITLASPTTVCMNDQVVITASGANSYDWIPSFATTQTVGYIATADRSYTVTGTDINMCKGTATISVIVSECTGISSGSLDDKNISVYPNPSSDKLNLVIGVRKDTPVKIEISDASGRRIVERQENFSATKNEVQLNVESLSKGIYFVKVIPENGAQRTLKFIKE